jgi:signal transduction histidine kinase
LQRSEASCSTFACRFGQRWKQSDLDYPLAEIPRAIDQCLDGLQRIARIVAAMKEFSHPGTDEKAPVDINRAVETTAAFSRNEWKYVAEVDLHLDDTLPLVPCLHGEFNQAILNLIVNAAQAIAGVVDETTSSKGKITVSTRCLSDAAEISVSDTGMGIPEAIRSRIFEPFFTTQTRRQRNRPRLILGARYHRKKTEGSAMVRLRGRTRHYVLHPAPSRRLHIACGRVISLFGTFWATSDRSRQIRPSPTFRVVSTVPGSRKAARGQRGRW